MAIQFLAAAAVLAADPFAQFLLTAEAKVMLERIEVAKGDGLKLREKHAFLPRLLQLWHLRRDHAGRFSRAAEMLLTPVGAEQATGEAIARYKATWASGRVLVACCGIGGELQALQAEEVIAVDSSWDALVCAAWNAPHATFVHARLEDALPHLGSFDHCFIDPDRRPGGRRRIALEDYTPLPSAVLPHIDAREIHMKVSPMITEAKADSVTWIAEGKTLKECVLHWGGSYPAAVQIHNSATFVYKSVDVAPPARQHSLLELSPALLRAGLVEEVAAQLGAVQIHPASSLLLGGVVPEALRPFVTSYEIIEELPYAPKLLKQRFKGESLVVKKRFFPLEPEAIRKQIGVKEGGDRILFCTTRPPQARVAFLCRRRQD